MHDRPRSSRQSQDRSRRACMPSPPRLLLSESPGIERRFSGRRGLGRRTEVAARRGSARRRGHRSCAVKYGCSAARSTATIRSSVNRLFLMRSIAGREPSSQESMERKKKAGHDSDGHEHQRTMPPQFQASWGFWTEYDAPWQEGQT